jgi:pyridoxal/pyridoxine/pyridoxamine kinase
VATSIPAQQNSLVTLAITHDKVSEIAVPRRATVPNGTGDLLAALFLSEYLATGYDGAKALASSVEAVDRVLDASIGKNELDLASDWRQDRLSKR